MSHGGLRPGAGRPAEPRDVRVQLSTWVTPETLDLLRAIARQSHSTIGETVDLVTAHHVHTPPEPAP